MGSNSLQTPKASHRIAGGGARFLRAAPRFSKPQRDAPLRRAIEIAWFDFRRKRGCTKSRTHQSLQCNVTVRVKFSDIPIAPLQGANVSNGMSTGGGAQKTRSAPGYSI